MGIWLITGTILIDSYHTGYNLDALSVYQECTQDRQFEKNIKIGFDFYIKNFLKRMVRQNTSTIKNIQ